MGDAGAGELFSGRHEFRDPGEGTARLIDAHVHVWRIGENGCSWPTAEFPAIHRDFDLNEFRAAAGDGMDGALLVQSQENSADTRWLLDMQDPLIAGVVGWADLTVPDAADQIRGLAAHPKLRGLRPMAQDRDADWYDRIGDPPLAALVETALVFDALVRPRHLEALARLAVRSPGLAIVIDHAAKPESGDFDSWARAIDSIARHPNVHCKLSGLITEDVTIADAFGVIWRAFGPARLIWGSDWPVVNLAASHAEWLKIAQSLVPVEHHAAVFGENARQLYRLTTGRSDGGKGS